MELPVDAEPAAVMSAAIALWRELRHPRLAELVDRIEDRLLAVSPRPPLETAEWQAIEAAGDPLDFRRLGEAAGHGSKEEVLRRVKALAARRDPRLARALLALLATPPYAGNKSRDLLGAIVEELAAAGDRRAAGPVDQLADRYLGIVSSRTGRWMVSELKAAARRLEAVEPAEPTAALEAACAALEARFGTRVPDAEAAEARRTLRELLAEVHAAPGDDGPRLVYADALLERGDPRGELITLQIARDRGTITDEGRAREEALLADKARMAAWAQPLSTWGECTFERGFPASIELYRLAEVDVADPAWATISDVSELSQVPPATAARICELPNLQRVETLPVPLLEELCRTPRPWWSVGADGARAPSAAAFAALPELFSLELRIDEAPPRELLASLPVRMLTLRLGGPCEALDLPANLLELELIVGGAPPRMDLAGLAHLADLRLEYGAAGGPLALPASLKRLHLVGREAALPAIAVARPSKLRRAYIHTFALAADALRDLASIEELDLAVLGELPAGALDELVRLRELTLLSTAALPPRALARLANLEELHVSSGETRQLQLDGLPIRDLWWTRCPLDELPPGLPLRHARVSLPDELDSLERFLARYPALEHLHLESSYETELDLGDAPTCRRLVELLERSGISACTLGPSYDTVELQRDPGGLLSRLRIEGASTHTGVLVARALTRVTSIESPKAKLPPKLARLVR